MEGFLSQMGFDFTTDLEEADLVLYNTCAVREHAQDRALGNVGALKRWKAERPERLIVLCGCMVQQMHVAEKIRKSYPYVSMVFGTHVIHKLPENMYRYLTGSRRVFDIPDEDGHIAEPLPVRRTGVKGWLPIMYGCNNFCTYCIVPYVRGRERSRKPEDIIAEAKEMIRDGYKEITLLGQNVNSYGKTLDHPITFAQLLKQINDLPGDFILRFMTSHPKDCTEELLETMKQCDKVAKHLHLPVQSGSDRILKAMNRGYTKEKYLSLAMKAKELMPDLCMTSDIIVGFPGEQYEDFLETMDLVKKVGYSALFTFVFSPRKGTPAAEMEDVISAKEKSAWFQGLLKVQEELAAEVTADYEGKTFRVLCEGMNEKGFYTGRTQGNILVEFSGKPEYINQFVDVTITEALSFVLKGEVR
jgi:tRNA-2-methylthio-N6-dimethylallyladenosine synthase